MGRQFWDRLYLYIMAVEVAVVTVCYLRKEEINKVIDILAVICSLIIICQLVNYRSLK
jgi:heme A synthase